MELMDLIKQHKRLLIVIFLVVVAPVALAYYYGKLNLTKFQPSFTPTPSKTLTYQCPSVQKFCSSGGDVHSNTRINITCRP